MGINDSKIQHPPQLKNRFCRKNNCQPFKPIAYADYGKWDFQTQQNHRGDLLIAASVA